MAYYEDLEKGARMNYRTARRQATDARNAYSGALMGFDPREYMKQAGGAMFSELSEQFAREQAQRAAGRNRRGLFGSVLGEGRAMQDLNERRARAMSRLAMQAGQMEQRRHGMLGNLYGIESGRENRYFDAATGLAVSGRQQEMMEKASRNQMWGNIISGGLTAGGAILGGMVGGPPGAMAGASIGGSLMGQGGSVNPHWADSWWREGFPMYEYDGQER